MLTRLRKHLSFANVVAVIALFIALGGGAYAAKKISGKSIKNNSIPAKKLKKSVLKGLDKCPSGAPNNTIGICYGASAGRRRTGTSRRSDCRTAGPAAADDRRGAAGQIKVGKVRRTRPGPTTSPTSIGLRAARG